MKIKLATFAAAAFFSTASLAESPTWNLVEAGYGQADIDDISEISPSGFSILGSGLIGENVFIHGSYSILTDDFEGVDLDLDQMSVGLGYRYGLNKTTDIYAAASYEYIEFAVSGFGESESDDDNGYGLTIGVRSRLTEQFEVDGSLGYVDIADESETSFGVSGHYYFTDELAVGLSLSSTADINIYGISLRYAF